MISDKMYDLINTQMTREYFSAFFYLNMAAWCDGNDLPGVAHWLKIQGQEELCHGQIMFNYLIDNQRTPVMGAIEKPRHEFKTVKDVFEAGLEHERFVVTKRINEIVDLAIAEKDHATNQAYQWFVGEQVEEEASFEQVLGKLKFLRENSPEMLMLDKELAMRVFAMPPLLVGKI